MIQMQFAEILSLVKKGDRSSTRFALVRIKWIPVTCWGFTCPWHYEMSLCKIHSAAALLCPTAAGLRQAGKPAVILYQAARPIPESNKEHDRNDSVSAHQDENNETKRCVIRLRWPLLSLQRMQCDHARMSNTLDDITQSNHPENFVFAIYYSESCMNSSFESRCRKYQRLWLASRGTESISSVLCLLPFYFDQALPKLSCIF